MGRVYSVSNRDSARALSSTPADRWLVSALALWIAVFHLVGPASTNAQIQEARVARIVTEYALTSAYSWEYSDPRNWRLLASNDDGEHWTVLDVRTNEVFRHRSQRRSFVITNETAFSTYRLEITNAPSVQLAELELLGVPLGVGRESDLEFVVTSSRAHPLFGPAAQAFDNDITTKWLDFGNDQGTCWIECHYRPHAENLLTNIHQFLVFEQRMANRVALVDRAPQILAKLSAHAPPPIRPLVGYVLTSANDAPSRDPRDWRFLGSNDGGKTWETLDVRQNASFANRLQRQVFSLKKQETYALYRLQIDSVRVPFGLPGGATCVQIAEVEPLYAPHDPGGKFSIVLSAQGENAPRETANQAFDGDAKTKWLDFCDDANTNKSSWIQWQYLQGEELPLINLHSLNAVRARRPETTALRLEALVVYWDEALKTIGLLDGSGFYLFRLEGDVGRPAFGERVLLSGQPQLGKGFPAVCRFELAHLRSPTILPTVLAEQELPESEEDVIGTCEGRVLSVSEDPLHADIRLAGDNPSEYLIVKLPNPAQRLLPKLPGCRVRVQGLVQSVLKESGQRVAGVIWVPDLEHIELAPTEKEWRTVREFSLESLNRATPGQLVRVRGTIGEPTSGRAALLQAGAHSLEIHAKDMTVWPQGAAVEVLGFMSKQAGKPMLELGCLRLLKETSPVADTELDPPPPEVAVTRIHQIYKELEKGPASNFFVTIRGVITYIDLGLASFYLQDGAEGIRVDGLLEAGLAPFLQQEGLCVELRGWVPTNQPVIYPAGFVKVLGRGRMPEPLRHAWDYLVTGKDFDNWVEVEGIVHEVADHRLMLAMQGGQLAVWINDIDRTAQEHLLGSLVRICGVCAPVINNRATQLGLRLLVPSLEQIVVLSRPPANLFDLRSTALANVMRLGARSTNFNVQFVKTAGVATYYEQKNLFIQEAGVGMRVALRENVSVEPGDLVEVVGFPQPDGFSPKLVQAVVRKTGRAGLPTPRAIDLWNPDLGEQDATRVQLEGIVRGSTLRESIQLLELYDPKRERAFTAFFSTNHGTLAPVPAGSRVRIAGVFKAKTDALPDFGQVISSFEMFANSPEDLVILERPSRWTAQKTLWALGGLGAALALVLGWVGSLRKQVQKRTLQLHQEIEQHKQTETALQSSEHFLRSMVESLPQNILRKDLEGCFTFVNGLFCRSVNKSMNEILGHTDYDLFPPELATKFRQDDQQVMSSGTLFHTVEENRNAAGEKIFVEVIKNPLYDASQRPIGLQVIFWDVTARERAEAEVARLHRHNAAILEAVTEGIIGLDLEGRITFVNPAAARLLGYEDKQLIGRHSHSTWHHTKADGKPYPSEECPIYATFHDGAVHTGASEVFWRQDGSSFPAEYNSTPIWENGQLAGAVVSFRDISERKEAEQRLESAHKELVVASRQAGMAEVATSVLHNVGNVLNSVNVSATLLAENLKKSKAASVAKLALLLGEHQAALATFLTEDPRGKQVPEYLKQLAQHLAAEQSLALNELEELTNHIDHIKDIVAMQQSYAKVSGLVETVDVTELIEDALRLNAGALARHDVNIVREYDARLPRVAVEKHKVLQILTNLIRNAKYACDDSGLLEKRVILRATNGDDRLKISVADNGVGIAPENLTRIFNHGFTTRKNGHGFGLHSGALAAKELGGSLLAHSDGPGKGAIFTLVLPIAKN